MKNQRTTRRGINKKAISNEALVNAALEAKRLGYHSYGQMQEAEYAKRYASNIKGLIEQKRREEGYMTIRERMQQSIPNNPGGTDKQTR